jgi:hypothetical protein
MFDQKFAGAAAGIFNASIISRELGLADVTDHRSTDGTMTPKPTVIEFLAPEQVSPAIAEAQELEEEGGEQPAEQ